MRRYVSGSLVIVALLVAVALPASAVDDIVIPINTVVRSDEGVLTQLRSEEVEPELVGSTCPVRAEAGNNRSVHPGNDLIISTGSDSTTLFDVEGVGDGVTVATSDLTLGSTVSVTLRMGPDRVFSAGITVTVACSETTPTSKPETTTSTKAETTTTTTVAETTATTTVAETTTTTTVAETTTTTKPESAAPTQTQATTTTTGATTTTRAPAAVTSSSTTPVETTTPEETTTTVDTEVLGVQIERGGDELPLTGASTELLTALGFTLLATGLMVRRLAKEN